MAKSLECNGPRALSRTHKSSEQGRAEGTARDNVMNSQPRLCGRLSSVRKEGWRWPSSKLWRGYESVCALSHFENARATGWRRPPRRARRSFFPSSPRRRRGKASDGVASCGGPGAPVRGPAPGRPHDPGRRKLLTTRREDPPPPPTPQRRPRDGPSPRHAVITPEPNLRPVPPDPNSRRDETPQE